MLKILKVFTKEYKEEYSYDNFLKKHIDKFKLIPNNYNSEKLNKIKSNFHLKI